MAELLITDRFKNRPRRTNASLEGCLRCRSPRRLGQEWPVERNGRLMLEDQE